MGKAEIISDQGSGLYQVKILYDESIINQKIKLYQNALNNVEASIATEQAKSDPDENTLTALNIRKNALSRTKAKYQNLLDVYDVVNIWCADHTEGLSGEVATLEIGTDRKNGINLMPGHEAGTTWSRSANGIAAPLLGLGVYNATLNFCLMPAIQKYRPTFRYAMITGINFDENTASVNLEPVASTIQEIDINQAPSLENVPIEYMTCNAAAFEIDDRVIIQFENFNQASPKIIGFRDNPRGCLPFIVVVYKGNAIVWDINADDLMPVPGLAQPASYSVVINTLSSLGYDVQTYQKITSIGSCNVSDELKIYEFDDMENIYGAHHEIDESEDLELVDTGEVYTAELIGEVTSVYDITAGSTSYVQAFIHIVTADYEASGTIGAAYAACLDINGLSKRKPVLYHSTGEMIYENILTDPGFGQTPYYTTSVIYSKNYHYKSTMDSSRDQENITTIAESFSGDNNGYPPGTNGWMVDESEALDKVGAFKNDVHISIKGGPIQSLVKQNVALIVEQPVLYNAVNDEVWGFCDVYVTDKGVKVDPDNPNSDYVYNYSDLKKLDSQKIYGYFETTHQNDMDERNTAAGLEVVILSSE